MADKVSNPASDFVPGLMAPQDVFEGEPVTISEEQINVLRAVVTRDANNELMSWREEIMQAWQQRLFNRGYQYILWSNYNGWAFPRVGSGYHPLDPDSRSQYVVNIYSAYGQVISSCLSREFPSTRFMPCRDDRDADITAAQTASKISRYVQRTLGGKELLRRIASILYTDGRAIGFTRYVKDAQRFGFANPNEAEGVVPEDENAPEMGGISIAPEGQESQPGIVGGEAPNGSDEQGETQDLASTGQENERTPRGQAITTIYGALEAKIPMHANCLAECDYVHITWETDLSTARAGSPDKADQIQAGQAGPGGDNIGRMARINCNSGMTNIFPGQDSRTSYVTHVYHWIRPSKFYDQSVPEAQRQSFLELFPLGCLIYFKGNTFIEARNICMDDHLKMIHGLEGDGAHRPSLGSFMVSIQRNLNNFVDLATDYLMRGVPLTHADSTLFNVDAINQQSNTVGAVIPFIAPETPGDTVVGRYWFQEPQIPFPEALMPMIQLFMEDMPQLISGAYPALQGDATGEQETAQGMAMQIDQAIGRLGPCWDRVKEGSCGFVEQAVKAMAKSGEQTIELVGEESLVVEMRELQGNFLGFPEADEGFPETWYKKQARIGMLITEAATNPFLASIVDTPSNLRLIKDASGLEELKIPKLISNDKQLGEIQELLKESPQPNPKFIQAQQQVEDAGLAAKQNPELLPAVQQMQMQAQQVPQMVSSVEVGKFDDHATEFQTCWEWLMSPTGRAMKNGSPEDKEHYTNVELHASEHQALMSQAPPVQSPPPRPTLNAKDMPPNVAAQIANKAGLQATPQEFQAQDEAEAAAKHPKIISPVVQ